MKDTDFKNLLQGVRELSAALKGDRRGVAHVDHVTPESVASIRAKLHLSQNEFARAFGISAGTLRNWEQGRRQPTGPARLLLRVAAKRPKAVLEALST